MNRYIEYIDVKYEVLEALRYFKPVVALESTMLINEKPWSENLEAAMELENIIRSNGATPAMMAIINGRLKIGLEDTEIEYLSKSKNVIKTSRKDLPWVISKKLTGATTMASTMVLASMAGIRIIASTGIEGIADLNELSWTDVAVICSGVNANLENATVQEKLNTLGIPVIGYKTSEFPYLDTTKNRFVVDMKLDTPLECAEMLKAKWDLDLTGGAIFSNPIPPELNGYESFETGEKIIESNSYLATKIAVQFAKLDEHRKSIVG